MEIKTVRDFLGHTIYEFDQRYALQTLKDNVSLLTPQHLDQINQVVVKAGHKLLGYDGQSLKGRCDSFVLKQMNPTDINLLWDAIRKIITLTAAEFGTQGITEWRQSRYVLRKIRLPGHADSNGPIQNKIRLTTNYSGSPYVDLARLYIKRARFGFFKRSGISSIDQLMVLSILSCMPSARSQILRRVINDEKIAHSEKVFSLFEEHTEWISKGKAGGIDAAGCEHFRKSRRW